VDGFHEGNLISIDCAMGPSGRKVPRRGDGEMRKGLLEASPRRQLKQSDSQQTTMTVPGNGLTTGRFGALTYIPKLEQL